MLLLYPIVCLLVFGQTLALLDKDIGEACTHNSDCKRAYSYCNPDKKCACMKGFDFTDCKPKPLCPDVAGIPFTGDAKPCQVFNWAFAGDNTATLLPFCPGGQFCYGHVRSYTGDKGVLEGHCCPGPMADAAFGLTCPESAPYNGTCLDMSRYGGGAPIPKELEPLCPMTHECIKQNHRNEQICCQNPCIGSNTHISILGQCREIVWFDAECEFSSQCPEKTVCRPNANGKKTCRCKDGERQDPSPTPHCVPI